MSRTSNYLGKTSDSSDPDEIDEATAANSREVFTSQQFVVFSATFQVPCFYFTMYHSSTLFIILSCLTIPLIIAQVALHCRLMNCSPPPCSVLVFLTMPRQPALLLLAPMPCFRSYRKEITQQQADRAGSYIRARLPQQSKSCSKRSRTTGTTRMQEYYSG